MDLAKITLPVLAVVMIATLCQCEISFPLLQRKTRSAPEECIVRDESDFKFSLNSSRNKTGHWSSQVRLELGEKEEETDSKKLEKGLWEVHLEEKVTKCSGFKTIQVVATITGPSPAARNIPLGYEFFPNVGYYKFHEYGKTWDVARNICRKEGGHLVVINSDQEANVLKNMFSKVGKSDKVKHDDFAFIGIHDRFVEGEFVTIFGEPVADTGFNTWTGPPDNSGGAENCGSVSRGGKMNDISCSWELFFICELEF